MKNLNLPTSFEEWNWTKDDDTIRAYYAISNQGYTAEFKASVWNSLCNKLNQTLTAMGLSWDSKYTNYSGVLLTGYYPTLTATIFNSVRHNIEVHVPTTWKWVFNRAYEGYVGRLDFRGVSTTSNPDTLFGSYILEIARKLNLLISIFKNEASLVEPNVTFTFSMDTSQVEFISLDAAILSVDLINYSVFDSVLSSIEPFELNNTNSKNTHYINEALLNLRDATQTLLINETFRLSASATILLEELYRNLNAYVYSTISENAKLAVSNNSRILNVNFRLETVNEATLILPDVIDMLEEFLISTSQVAELTELEPLTLYIDTLNKIYESAQMKIANPRVLQGYATYKNLAYGDMETITGSMLYTIVSELFRIQRATMNRAIAVRARSTVYAIANINSNAHSRESSIIPTTEINHVYGINASSIAFERKLLDSVIEHLLTDEGNAVVKEAKALEPDHILSNLEINNSEIEVKLIKQIAHSHLHILDIISELASGQSRIIDTTVHNELMVNEATLIGYVDDRMVSAFAEYFTNGIYNLDLLYYEDDVFITDYLSSTKSSALINTILPIELVINHIERGSFQAEPSMKLAEETMHIYEHAFQDSSLANLVKVNLSAFNVHTSNSTIINSTIEFDPSSWKNPEKIEDLLLIYQVYEVEQDGTNLKLK
jgi:hypothetical protein